MIRRTKIVCTIGPASVTPRALEELIGAGMDVARLNCAHGTSAERARTLADIRAAAERLDRPVAVLLDLAGPKVRVGDFAAGPVTLESGARFVLTARDVPGDAGEVSVSYAGLPSDVEVGDSLLLSDGALELEVEQITRAGDVVCRVVVGGSLAAGKGINVPSRSLGVDFLSERDRRDLRFAVEAQVDYVALSFVRTAGDVRAAREVRDAAGGGGPPLIAKIEKHEALSRIEAILAEADGIMVARGDLGVDIPIERVPRVQKQLIDQANRASRPVITATQMLRSMVDSPRPTRAEATDVANAILDGTDAVMLSEETAIGRYPAAAVRMMDRLARDAEVACARSFDGGGTGAMLARQEAVALAAARLAEQIGAAAILTCTQSGHTTRLVARARPRVPLLALTPDAATRRRLALVWGAVPLLMPPAEGAEGMEREAVRTAMAAGLVRERDVVVLTAGLPLHEPGGTNTVKVAVAGAGT